MTIPRAKCLLFRPTAYKSNPEGRSILRTAYRPWYNLTQIENIEGIGIERDLAGLPVVKVPPEVMAGKGGGASAEANAIYQAVRAARGEHPPERAERDCVPPRL